MTTLLSRRKLFNGLQERHRHFSQSNQCEMQFTIYLPPQTQHGYRVPALYWLSGLDNSFQEFAAQSGAQRFAAQWGIALVMPDTSPRGEHIPDSNERGIGQSASFYLNATQSPWDKHYHMHHYISQELPKLIETQFPVNTQRSIFGHSMGGLGALQIALSHPERYAAVSAFAPMLHPSEASLGQKAFTAYLGENRKTWQAYDPTYLVAQAHKKLPIYIDQGTSDPVLKSQLQASQFLAAARGAGFNVRYNLRQGYDHSHCFIASFIDTHIEFHADAFGL